MTRWLLLLTFTACAAPATTADAPDAPDAAGDGHVDAGADAQADVPAGPDIAAIDSSIFCDDPCDDTNPCTDDVCYRTIGCTHVPHAGPCDDGNPCTWKDTCTEDLCHGVTNPCDDGLACTTDSCALPAGCTHTGAGC